jgi:HK97 family phage major capsid protein
MSTTTDSEGGFTVPDLLGGEIIDSLKAFGGMREVATVLRTADGAPLNYPTSDGTSEVGEILAENAAATDADAVFGTVPVPVYKYSSKVITVPIELLQDSAFDLEGFLASRIQTRLGRITNTHYTTGTGSSQPNGIVTAAGTGVTAATGGATTFTYANLVALQHSVDPAYRQNGATFMMSDAAVRVAKLIVDTTGRPIFLPGYDPANNGSVDRILGDRVVVNQSVAVPAANAKSIVYGDLSKYIIRDAMAMTMMRFTDSAYAKKGQVGFLAMLRSGGNLTDTGAVKLFVHSAT